MIRTKEKLGAFLLALMMVLPLFAFVTMIETKAALAVVGTEDNPYLISTADELRAIPSIGLGYHYKLVNDIDLEGTGYTAIGNKTNKFTGTFDGDGHIIKNLNSSVGSDSYAGVIGYAQNAVIKNLGVENARIAVTHTSIGGGMGSIVGTASSSKIINCYSVDLDIKGIGNNLTWANMGGIIGYSDGSVIEQCFTTGKIDGVINSSGISTGGIVGYALNGTKIENCYSRTDVAGGLYTGGIAGSLNDSEVTKTYATGTITGGGFSGSIGVTFTSSNKIEKNVGLSMTIKGNSPFRVVKVVHEGEELAENLAYEDMVVMQNNNQLDIKSTNPSADSPNGQNTSMADLQKQSTYEALGWDFDNVWIMDQNVSEFPILSQLPAEQQHKENVIGTEDNPYLISTADELRAIPSIGLGYHYKLVNDIDLEGTGYTAIGNKTNKFTGTFDGDGHIIKNLNSSVGSDSYAGVIGYAQNAVIKNLGVENARIAVTHTSIGGGMGSIVGTASSSKIINCYSVDLDIKGIGNNLTWANMGGIIGYSDGSVIEQCFTTGKIDGVINSSGISTGGIVGYALNGTKIENCYSRTDVAGGLYTGGIAGSLNDSEVTKTYATGTITGGGFSGSTGVTFTSSNKIEKNVGLSMTIKGNSPFRVVKVVHEGEELAENLAYEDMVVMQNNNQLDIKSTNPSADSPNGQNTSMADLQKQSTYEALGWDFENVWVMEDLPKLRMIGGGSTPDPVPANSVNINPEELELNIDEEYQLMATVTPANATNKNVTWTSDDTSIATVDNTGKVVAIAPGEATITVITEDGGHTATCQVIVKAPTDIEPIWINDTEEGTGNNQIEYTGVWNFSPSKSGCYQNDDHASNRIGAFFTVRFEGTQIKWIGMKNTTCGMAEIYIDDVLVETVDTYSTTRDMQQVLFDSGALPDGQHTLKVVVIEYMNPASTARYITADAFWILPSGSIIEPTTVTINDTETGTDNDKIEYVGNWWHQAQSGNYMDDEHVTNSPDSYFQVRFEGTGIKWYSAFAHDRGIAAVYIDDVFVQYVDCYKLEYEPSSLVFDSGPLTNGQHSLKVVLTNDKNPAATNGYTTVDKIIITK